MRQRRARLLIPLTNIGILVTYGAYGTIHSSFGISTFDTVVTGLIILLALFSLILGIWICKRKKRRLTEKMSVSATNGSLGLIAINELVTEHLFSQWLAFTLAVLLIVWILGTLDDYVFSEVYLDE